MKAVFLLGAFALALVAGLEQTENKNVAAPSDNLLRDTRDASAKKSGKKKGPARKKRKNTGQRKRKGQKGKGKKTKNKNRKARKSKKGKEKKRKGGKKAGGRKRNGNGKKSGKKNSKKPDKVRKTVKVNPRQSQCSNDFLKYAPKFNTRNENMKRRARRVAGWLGIMDKKAGNAATAFEDAKNALSAATNDGTSCMSGKDVHY